MQTHLKPHLNGTFSDLLGDVVDEGGDFGAGVVGGARQLQSLALQLLRLARHHDGLLFNQTTPQTGHLSQGI